MVGPISLKDIRFSALKSQCKQDKITMLYYGRYLEKVTTQVKGEKNLLFLPNSVAAHFMLKMSINIRRVKSQAWEKKLLS